MTTSRRHSIIDGSAEGMVPLNLPIESLSWEKGRRTRRGVLRPFYIKWQFERVYTYLERERIAKAVLFLYTKIVAVFPYTVVQTPGPRIREEKKVRMRWR